MVVFGGEMFTGIVDHCGRIVKIDKTPDAVSVWIESNFTDCTPGESIAIDGICLTVNDPTPSQFRVDLSPETCRLTTGNQFQVGRLVNLERSLRLTDRLGGHMVLGHVDQQCQLQSKTTIKEFIEMNFTGLVPQAQRFFVTKGSVSVNGVSLTINQVFDGGFQVMLIPHTLGRTNLGELKVGDKVNIEYDWLAKMIAHQVQEVIHFYLPQSVN